MSLNDAVLHVMSISRDTYHFVKILLVLKNN